MSMQQNGTQDSGPFQYEKGVFVSYAWGGEAEEIVNQIDQVLQSRGVKVIRDKRDLGYRGSVREFMKRMGKSNCVIVVISDKYLRSPACMSELMEIAEGKEFRDRIFPVVLDDAIIYDPIKRLEYVKYWEDKRAELAAAIGTVDPANLQGIRDEMDLYDRIRDEISGLTSTLKDMNTLTPEMHRQGDYQILADAIAKRLTSKDPLTLKKIADPDRRLDAAMPKACHVGYMTEVRVLIAVPDSAGLRAFLPDFTESGELIAKGDVEAAAVPIEFPYDEKTDQLLPAHLHVVIDAPYFQVRQRVQQILVPPYRDSGVLTFFLTPSKPQPIGRVSVKLYQDKDRAIALGSVTLTTIVNSQRTERIEYAWQLAALALISSSTLSRSSSRELAGTLTDPTSYQMPNTPQSDYPPSPAKPRRRKRKLAVEIQAAIIGAIATLCAAMWATGIGPLLIDAINNALAPPPACITEDDILVRLHFWRGQQKFATLAPLESIDLQPDLTVDLQVEIRSVSDKALPTLECAWSNTGIATEGRLIHTVGCNVDYQSGRATISDILSLQLSQPTCSALPPYAFFISP